MPDAGPFRFFFEGRECRVEAVLDQWYEPQSISYKVCADIIRHRTAIPDTE